MSSDCVELYQVFLYLEVINEKEAYFKFHSVLPMPEETGLDTPHPVTP